ncbi:hypothetical protein NST04_33630 [Paenibacillus sp. FSL H7-0756]|uniref:hypothetical protein n=1 Tax=Paenibacillus sp. FSL H7-0756 TaxID=2954738 RepID=UPI0030F860C9
MFDRDALEFLAQSGKTEFVTLNGQQYATKKLYEVTEPTPAPLTVHNLTGLVRYLQSGFDREAPLLIQVVSPTQVIASSSFNHDYARRNIIEAKALLPRFDYGDLYDAEAFVIKLQSCFVNSDQRAALLKVVGNIKEENVRQTGDDGVSQSVTAKTGVATVENVKVPNPVTLAPFRTFVEITQPESAFVFRMKDGPRAALYEADGGAWRNTAIASIAQYLSKELSDLIDGGQIVVIA